MRMAKTCILREGGERERGGEASINKTIVESTICRSSRVGVVGVMVTKNGIGMNVLHEKRTRREDVLFNAISFG